MALGKVRCAGEPVAVVLAEEPKIAEAAAQEISVDYEELPAVLDEFETLTATTFVHEALKPAGIFADLKHLAGKRVSAAGCRSTLRDVRVLRDFLGERDWHTAAWRYAQEHHRYHSSLHRIHTWFRDLWFGVGAEANDMRARALPRIAEDPSRVPDFIA